MRELIFIYLLTVFLIPAPLFAQSGNSKLNIANHLSVLITEVLFDPVPVVGLPPYEYVELFNRGVDTLNLESWKLRVGEKTVPLPFSRIAPSQFVILTRASAFEEFAQNGHDVLALSTWATLRNSGQFIALLSPTGEIIHFMTYHPAQFEGGLKQEGGWSLELIDFDKPCHKGAWLPSIAKAGGTPGVENSMNFSTDEPSPPLPLRAGIVDSNKLFLTLNMPVLPLWTPGWFNFVVEPSELYVSSWSYLDDRPWMISIILSDSIKPNTRYRLTVGGDAVDCAGAGLIKGTVAFGKPEAANPGDIVISEIMYDPEDSNPEFIGLHNRSDKILALNSLYFAVCDDDGVISRYSKPVEQSFLMFPGEEYVLTCDEYLLGSKGPEIPPGRISGREDLPALANQGSIICVLDENQQILDKVRYEPGWHDSTIDQTKGISLERINLDISGWFSSNWHSASAICGGSTPGMPNSQLAVYHDDMGVFSLVSPAFSPNRDGYDDYLLISISTGEVGWIGNGGIWDLSGTSVKVLSDPGFLPTKGIIKWDGNDELGNRVPTGYYIIIINYIRPDGSKGRWKEACIVQ